MAWTAFYLLSNISPSAVALCLLQSIVSNFFLHSPPIALAKSFSELSVLGMDHY